MEGNRKQLKYLRVEAQYRIWTSELESNHEGEIHSCGWWTVLNTKKNGRRTSLFPWTHTEQLSLTLKRSYNMIPKHITGRNPSRTRLTCQQSVKSKVFAVDCMRISSIASWVMLHGVKYTSRILGNQHVVFSARKVVLIPPLELSAVHLGSLIVPRGSVALERESFTGLPVYLFFASSVLRVNFQSARLEYVGDNGCWGFVQIVFWLVFVLTEIMLCYLFFAWIFSQISREWC